MPHPKRNTRKSLKKKTKQPHALDRSSSTSPSPASSAYESEQGRIPQRQPATERHSFDSTLFVSPAPKHAPPAATPSLFFSLLNNDSNPSGSSTMSSHHAITGASRARSPPPPFVTTSNSSSSYGHHMTEINHNLSSSKDRFLYVGKGRQLHHHSEPSTPFVHPVSLSSGAVASMAALSATSGSSPYHTHHYHAPLSQKRPTHSRRSSYSNIPSSQATPANGYGEVPDQRQNAGFFNMAIFDPAPDHTRSTRSSTDHLHNLNQLSIRSASRPPSIESINSSNSVPLAPPPPPPPPFYRRFLNHFSNRVIKRHIKFAIAFFLTSILALVPQIANVLGPTPYLANVTVVFMHPSRTVGSMLEATFFSVVGGLLAAVWIIPCDVIVVEFNKKHMSPDGTTAAWAIEAAWFFMGVWMMTTAKARYAKLNCAFIMFTIAGIFAFTRNTKNTVFNAHSVMELLGPMLLGVLVSLIVCIVFWPETASQGLGRAFNESLDTSRELLNLCTRSFLLNHKTIALPKSALEKAQGEVRQAQKKLHNAYRETRYEMTYSRADPADYKEVRVIVSAMMRHLGSMSLVVQNERLLFLGNNERDDDDLNTASGDSASERWLSEGSCCSDSECTCSDSECSSDSDSDDDIPTKHDRRHGKKRNIHDYPEDEAGDYFGKVAIETPGGTSRDPHDTLDSMTSTKDHNHPHQHHHHYKRHHHHRHRLGESGNRRDETCSKKRRQNRTSAAELRRIRQLLHRAENSTAALLNERQENQRRLRQQQEEQLAQMTQIFQQSGFATAPPTPSGRGLGIYKQYKASKKKGKGKKQETDGNTSSASSAKGDSFFGAMAMTPIIRSTVTSPASSRPNSIYEETNLDTVKSFKSLFSVRSGGNMFKPNRPSSLRGLKIGKKRKDKKAKSGDDYIHSGYSSPVEHASGIPIDYTRTAPTTLGGPYTEEELDQRQLARAAMAYHKKELERLKRERKRVSREEKMLRRKVKEEEKKKAEAVEAGATDILPPKEVTFGDRKLFMSFLDNVREPLQRLSESCSRVMVAMEREIVSGLNVENDRLERIRRKNAQRAAALKAAEAKLASELAVADGQPPSPALRPAGILRQPTMLFKRAISFTSKVGKNQDTADNHAKLHGGGSGDNSAATPAPSTSDTRNDRWNAFRSLVGLRRRSFTATEEIEYANALSRKNEDSGDSNGQTQEKSQFTSHHNEKDAPNKSHFTTTKHRPIPQHVTLSATLDVDEDEEFILPADMTYVEFLSQELEKFDVAEAEGLRNLVSSQPTLDVGPREEVFLIFFFLFALREIARELLRLGRYVEEMDAKWKEQQRRRRLWWPKVMGNFWQWFAWASYSQIKTNEGYGSLTVNMTKNLEHRELPRTIEEEKAVVVAKAARAAKEKAEQEKKRKEAEEAAIRFPPLRRSATFSALVHRRGHHVNDIEMGTGELTGKSGHSFLGRRSASKERQQRRHGTFFGFELPRRPRSQERSSTWGRNRRQSTGDYVGSKELSRVGIGSPRYAEKSVVEEPLEIVVETTRENDYASESEEPSQKLVVEESGRPQPSSMTGKYAVVEIPSFNTLQRLREAREDQRKSGEQVLSENSQYSGAMLSPRVNTIRSYSTAPSSAAAGTFSHGSQPGNVRPGRLHLVGDSEVSSDPAQLSKHAWASQSVGHTMEPDHQHQRGRNDSIRRAIQMHERELDDEVDHSSESTNDSSDDGEAGHNRNRRLPRRVLDKLHQSMGSKRPTSPVQQQRIQERPEHHETPRRIFVEVQKPKTMRYKIWESLQFFKSEDFRFGLKMAMALTFIGLWAWLNWSSRALATDRGQWAMLTVMAVLSPTVGATFSVCAMRVAGTLVGTLWALLTYLALPRNPYVICAMMLVIVFASAFLILESAHPKLGIIMLLSYSSITFIMYEGHTPETIYEVCYKRAITVIVGIIISVIMNSLLWPIMARRELRKEIALLIGREGVLFAELVNKFLLEDPAQARAHPFYEREMEQQKAFSRRHVDEVDDEDDGGVEGYDYGDNRTDLIARLPKESSRNGPNQQQRQSIASAAPSVKGSSNISKKGSEEAASDKADIDPDRLAFQHVEHQLQTKIIKILQLLELSESEPRMKGKFPMKLYQKIIQSCQNILDRLISMRMAAQLLSPEVRELVTGPMNYYRRDMVGALLLYFSVLSSSLASKSPLPPYLPSARMARLRVIYNVREAIAAHQAVTGEDHYTYIYYYAFSSALEEVIEELELLAILLKPIVGVTTVTTAPGFNYHFSGDQLGLDSAVTTTNFQPPLLNPSSTAAMLGVEDMARSQYGHQEPTFSSAPAHQDITSSTARQNQLFSNPDILNRAGSAEDVVASPLEKHPSNDSLRKKALRQAQAMGSTPSAIQPARSATRSKPALQVTTALQALKMDGQQGHSPTFAQSPAVMDERILGGTRQMQRLKEAIKAAQEASEHHVVELPSPNVGPPAGVGITVPTKNLPPSVATQLATVLSNDQTPMLPLTPHSQVNRDAPRALSRSPPRAPSLPSVAKHGNIVVAPSETLSPAPSAKHKNVQAMLSETPSTAVPISPPSMGIVTPFGSGLVPEAPLPLHLIPRRQTTVTQSSAVNETTSSNDSSNDSSSRHHSPDQPSTHHGHHHHHYNH